ncbi:membrane protein [Roseivivax halodurans JCM 10272]|uniref:Murein endopeptidase K n=1 Tax=Roseivivax halodurans JCM 10272 TaxID=1449350 RepID=X7EKD4_9RHOB|nr:DUF882 domain-containing protein [Roseivivax halodurans]ETX15636.1 membrane protein [Roseivivax halodurans JCM 10272]
MSTHPVSAGRIDRRRLLATLGAGLSVPLVAGCGIRSHEPLPDPSRPGTRLDAMVRDVDSHLNVVNAHTGERVAVRFMSGGRERRGALRKLDWIFRDWRDEEAPDIDRRVYWALAALSNSAKRNGHSGEITLLSGYRTAHTTQLLQSQSAGASSTSYHMRRRAADIRFEGIPPQEVARLAEWFEVGGVGRYGSRFTHIDSGPVRTWGS